jgi:YfiR/HmsC-like
MSLRISFGIALWATLGRGAGGPAIDEYAMKAAFIYNFAKFVAWPPQAFRTSTDPITICVLGQNPFGSGLDDVVSGKAIEGRAFVVRRLSGEQSPAGCQILFVSSSERKRLHAIFDEIKTRGVLTVGETDTFASEGGMINFQVQAGRVRFQVNVDAAEQANLHISSKLLSLAQIVKR